MGKRTYVQEAKGKLELQTETGIGYARQHSCSYRGHPRRGDVAWPPPSRGLPPPSPQESSKMKYKSGTVMGGRNLVHDCSVCRSIGYFLEPLIVIGLFAKKPISIRFVGITNDSKDSCVDTFRSTTLPMLKRFGVPSKGLGLKIESSGSPSHGGGQVIVTIPVIDNALKTVTTKDTIEQGKHETTKHIICLANFAAIPAICAAIIKLTPPCGHSCRTLVATLAVTSCCHSCSHFCRFAANPTANFAAYLAAKLVALLPLLQPTLQPILLPFLQPLAVLQPQ
ncbi:hypothetical protein Patl1_24206 [Pistacia atlantica]|uniref:Uncharacterized protein n=1 Tax=Pistacia atlantica TaxID=434234 RepID=A0ACC0ZWR1_9ROSI|nr:hypothetical protein Patl1_24206 [Pistacia atlantica]